MSVRLIIGIILSALVVVAPASARSMTPQDLDLIARVLQFSIPPVGDVAKVIVVYVPGDEADREEAQRLRDELAAGKPGQRVRLNVLVQRSDQLDLTDTQAIVLTPGHENGSARIAEVASASGVMTISSSKQCAERNLCVFSVTSNPFITLWYSRTAARAAGLRFAPALLMLAKKS